MVLDSLEILTNHWLIKLGITGDIITVIRWFFFKFSITHLCSLSAYKIIIVSMIKTLQY